MLSLLALAAACALGPLPDPQCTPGLALSVTVSEVCTAGYAKTARSVSAKVKAEVFREYGVTKHPHGSYEIDHLVPLELGGSNDIRNLWPEAAQPKPGFHEKDKVENDLHRRACAGRITLRAAQELIRSNWLKLWPRHIEPRPQHLPRPVHSSQASA